jgi:hypothetical protein
MKQGGDSQNHSCLLLGEKALSALRGNDETAHDGIERMRIRPEIWSLNIFFRVAFVDAQAQLYTDEAGAVLQCSKRTAQCIRGLRLIQIRSH